MRLVSNDISLRTAKVTAVFCALAAAVYGAAQAEPSPLVALFLSFGPLLAVILWLQKDARRTGVGSVLDLGYFLLAAWPIVIPWYAFKTRGRAGWRLLLGLFTLISSAYLGPGTSFTPRRCPGCKRVRRNSGWHLTNTRMQPPRGPFVPSTIAAWRAADAPSC